MLEIYKNQRRILLYTRQPSGQWAISYKLCQQ